VDLSLVEARAARLMGGHTIFFLQGATVMTKNEHPSWKLTLPWFLCLEVFDATFDAHVIAQAAL
jgi:hypothetical protein